MERRSVGLAKAAKAEARLSELTDRAERGEEIVITTGAGQRARPSTPRRGTLRTHALDIRMLVAACFAYALTIPQQCLYFRPLPHGQGRFALGRARPSGAPSASRSTRIKPAGGRWLRSSSAM